MKRNQISTPAKKAKRSRTTQVLTRYVPLGRGVRGETKAVDFATTSSTFVLNSAAGNAACLNLTEAGPSFYQRIGRKIAMQSVYLNGYINALGASLNEEYLRVMIVYDLSPNGASPAWSDVVQATTQANAVSSLTLDGINLNNRDRFKIVLDKRFYLTALNAVSQPVNGPFGTNNVGDGQMKIQEFRQLKRLETQYGADSTLGVVGDLRTGGLFLMLQGTVGAQWQLTWTTRVRYTDN